MNTVFDNEKTLEIILRKATDWQYLIIVNGYVSGQVMDDELYPTLIQKRFLDEMEIGDEFTCSLINDDDTMSVDDFDLERRLSR